MKTNRQNLFRSSVLRFVAAATLAVGGLSSSAFSQTTYYWDGNGATTGSGATTLTGTWGTIPYWGTSATGTSVTTAEALSSLDTAVFAANDAVGANNFNGGYTVTLDAARSVAGIVIAGASVGSGNTGGTLTLAGTGSPGLTIGSGGVTLNGANGDPNFAASIGTITLGADQTWYVAPARPLKIHAAVAGNATAGNTRVWTLGFLSQHTNEFSNVISNGLAGGALAFTLNNTNGTITGGGTNSITGIANSYTGKTTISRGLLEVRSLADAGVNSSLGAPAGTDSIIDIGSSTFSGTLKYAGVAASSSNRVLNMAGTTAGATLTNDSATANTISLTGGMTNAGGGNKTLTLNGSNVGNNTLGVVSNAIIDLSTTAISKSGAGVWVLGGVNTYSGGTNISAGTLSISSSGTLGSNVVGNNITISGGNLLLSAASNFGASQSITVNSGGVGVGYAPTSLPTLTDNTGANGGVYGINYSGDGSVTSLSSLYNGNWFLGSFTTGTYTGASLAAGNGSKYRFGGGGGTLTVQNNVLIGANDLVVGGTGGGNVILPGANTYTGKTTLQNGTLRVSSLNKVVGGSASSSLGAPSSVANGTIDIGSGSNAVTLAYTGTGETTDRVVNFTGTTGTVAFTNSGAGNLVFSNPPTFTGTGARTIQLGATTDSKGGSLTGLADNGANKTAVTKAGLSNSTWSLPGNTFTGTVKIDGGVLELSLTSLASTYINLDGDGTSSYAVIQTNGTLNRALGNTVNTGVIRVGINSGFAAKGGPLTVTLNANALLTWQSANFLGAGDERLVFGSTTADSQVEFTNPINLNTNDAFQRRIYVEQGVGGDSALLSGVLSPGLLGGGPALAPTGLEKLGGGTLILGAANTYPGMTSVSAGKLLVNGSTSTGNVAVNSTGTLGGTGTIGGAITVNSSGTLAPGASIGTLTASSSVTFVAGSSFAVELNAVTSDRVNVTGNLNITGATLDLTSLVTPAAPVYVLASYGSLTGTAFSTVNGLPSGYELQLGYNGGTQIALVQTGPVTPYSAWASSKGLSGLDAQPGADPDKDGVPNKIEFALSADPNSGSSRGLVFGKMATVGLESKVLTFTIAVLNDPATPPPSAPPAFSSVANRMTATVQGITYTIEASNNLVDWGGPVVTEVTGDDADDALAIQNEFITPDDGWSYKTFRTEGSAPSDSSDFIRVGVE